MIKKCMVMVMKETAQNSLYIHTMISYDHKECALMFYEKKQRLLAFAEWSPNVIFSKLTHNVWGLRGVLLYFTRTSDFRKPSNGN